MRIRGYQGSDEAAVLALHVHAMEHAGAYLPGPWDEDLGVIDKVYDEFLVGYAGEQLVAMGGLRRLREALGEIKRMRVHPDHQRQGFGQAILDKLEACAQRLGVHELVLDATAAQTAARAFYRKNGYSETRREEHGSFVLVFFHKHLDESTAPDATN